MARRAPSPPRSQTAGKPRRGSSAAERKLGARIAALEDRVARLETGRPPPGDGRMAARKPRAAPRCPGCGLPFRRKAGRCANCGRPLSSL